ncbi:MAG TPA: LptF/LptG family permease [Bacteriovoracaceae bacterium]|nr:LptF/LptG family permease [Bacteriovoracaceae bacterium]
MKLLLQRYLAAQFIMPLIVSTIFFISFLMTFELFRLTELLVTRDISFWFIIGLLGNIALSFMPLSLPIAVFFSTIYCLNKLSSDSEYIAMRAGGMTKFRILLPFLLVAALLTVSVYQLNQSVIPQSNKEFRRKVNFLTSSGVLAGIKPGQFFTLIPKVTLFASRATKYGRNLEEVFLHLNENKAENKVIFAEKGELLFERHAQDLTEKLTLTLFNGNIVGQSKDNNLEKILFNKYVFPISQSQFDDRFGVKENMLTSRELEGVLTMTEAEAKKKYDWNKKTLFNAKYEYWNRKNGAYICFVFCFLGFTLGITGTRGKSKNSGFVGLICLLVYYTLYFSLVSVAKKEVIPLPLAVYLPGGIMLCLGLWFYSKLDWSS